MRRKRSANSSPAGSAVSRAHFCVRSHRPVRPTNWPGVHAQGIVLQPQRGTDLHVGVGVLAAPQEDFLHQMGFQPLFLEKLGVIVGIAGVGGDGLKGHQSAHAMVAVGVGLGAPRIDAHHHIGPVLAYSPRDPPCGSRGCPQGCRRVCAGR